jgi:PPOX class probable F420-dependent enzyme
VVHDAGMDDIQAGPAPERIEHFLRTEEVLWLSTRGTDGFPGLVPIWFSWDGAAILLVSKPDAEKVQDLRADPRVMVALGNAEEDFDVGLIEARAELLDVPADDFLPLSHWRKYARDLAGIGLTREEYVRTYSQSIRIVPLRYLGWRGRGRPTGRIESDDPAPGRYDSPTRWVSGGPGQAYRRDRGARDRASQPRYPLHA